MTTLVVLKPEMIILFAYESWTRVDDGLLVEVGGLPYVCVECKRHR
jgi:hypothetical protein